jgi:hypothetical protein
MAVDNIAPTVHNCTQLYTAVHNVTVHNPPSELYPDLHLDQPTLQLTALQDTVAFDRRTNTDWNTNANAIMVLLQYKTCTGR